MERYGKRPKARKNQEIDGKRENNGKRHEAAENDETRQTGTDDARSGAGRAAAGGQS